MKKTVLITGASSGFGNLAAKKFQKEGWNVIATMRSPQKEQELNKINNILVTRLDVTNKESIRTAVNEGIAKFGGIHALVNNAGYGIAGFLEEASDEEIRTQVDTNFIGLVNVIQEVVPQMRKQQEGVIINITSAGGNIGMPMLSLYSATKFAVEGLSESISYELKQFGIKVKTIAPGAFKTGFGDATQFLQGQKKSALDERREKFIKHYGEMVKQPPRPFGFGDPQVVADKIFEAATKNTAHRIFVGTDAKMLSRINKWMPRNTLFNMLYNSVIPK